MLGLGGLLVKEARLRAGLTQAELARRLGSAQPVVARWETGAAAPSLDTVVRAVRACGLELEVALVEPDDSDRRQIVQNLKLTPAQRADLVVNMLEVERMLHAARPVDVPAADRG